MNRQTYLAKNDEVDKQWWLVDAKDLVLGRLSVKLATILTGKTKPQYTPHHDVGDCVVVVNAEKIRLTGNKAAQKMHLTYSGHPGGQKAFSYEWMLQNKPEELLANAVRRMMPKNKLAAQQLKKLRVYRGEAHPHHAQQPEPLEISL